MGRCSNRLGGFTPTAILFLISAMVIGLGADTDAGTFFLKATKNVPRIGRRSGGGEGTWFIKSGGKNVPMMGRRSDNTWASKDSTLPWSSSRQELTPNRVARIGPSSLATLWNSPTRSQIPNTRTRNVYEAESTPDSSEENGLMGPRYDLFDNSQADSSSEEIEFSTAQMVAPPPLQQYQRLPQEGGYRPRREGQPEK
ncbi:Hypothetical predicted protein [Cloeon dipterum]|uniref:Secreted protein n=1 Tax=Cloeon dipterum TaxID=197152 RepID=A0A8S1CU34_9INSE|nr:Hypothetical predicted protein [Cloeon dipterum]